MSYIIFGLIVLVLLVFIVAVIALAYRIGKSLFSLIFKGREFKDQAAKRAGIAVAILAVTFIGHTVFEAVFPPDDFYFVEFQTVTMREVPKSAEVLYKSASFPDFHGDYCSFSRIKLDINDFEDLLRNIELDSRFKSELISGSPEESEAFRTLVKIPSLIEYSRPEKGRPDHYFGIRFLNTREHVEVSVCIT